MSGWISVKDRMPESGMRVMFFWMNDYIPPKPRTSVGFYAAKHDIDASHWDDCDAVADYDESTDSVYCPEGWHEDMWEAEYFLPVSGITHWMPLPEQPK